MQTPSHVLRHLARTLVASREIYYHGTESKAARKILAQGFIPDPKNKIWDETSAAPSMYGTYLSSKLMTAVRMSLDAAKKRDSFPVVFEVQLETRTGLVDEDELPGLSPYWNTFKQYGSLDAVPQHLVTEAATEYVRNLSHNYEVNPKEFQSLGRKVVECLKSYLDARYHHRDWELDPKVREIRDSLVRTLGTAGPKFQNNENIRIVEPIGFKGANKILSAIQLDVDLNPAVLWGNPGYLDDVVEMVKKNPSWKRSFDKISTKNLEIHWVKPDLQDETGEYFENPYTIKTFKQQGFEFNTEDELLNFLNKGALKTIPLSKLKTVQNLTITDEDFKKELQDSEYRASFESMSETLKTKGSITLPAPILISFLTMLYLYGGNRRVNLAKQNDVEVKAWVIDTN